MSCGFVSLQPYPRDFRLRAGFLQIVLQFSVSGLGNHVASSEKPIYDRTVMLSYPSILSCELGAFRDTP